eukprot:365192-Chlamydomonas_euryale.AAC.22
MSPQTRNTASKAGNEQLSSTDGSMIPSYSGQAERSKSIVGGEVVPVFFSLRKCIWLTIGVGLYIAGLVMSIIGFTDIFKVRALDEIYSSSTWGQFNDAFIAIVILFGVLQLSTLFLVLFMRSHSMAFTIIKLLYISTYCLPCLHVQLLLGCIDCQNPCARWQNVDQSAFVFQALYNGLLVIQINVTVCVFGVGLMLWAMRYVLGLGCTAVLSKLVLAQIFNDLCLNLSVIGLGEKAICGSDLVNVSTNLCNSLHAHVHAPEGTSAPALLAMFPLWSVPRRPFMQQRREFALRSIRALCTYPASLAHCFTPFYLCLHCRCATSGQI